MRALAGIGWAGTYMTGLKLLADRVNPALMSRAVAGHAASIGIAGSLSFLFAGALNGSLGWRATFIASGIAAMVGWLIVFIWAPPREHPRDARADGALFDFRPVLRNRSAMAYALAYCAHTWEMNALRGWVVAFLAYVIAATGDRSAWIGADRRRHRHGIHRHLDERGRQRAVDPSRAPATGPSGHAVVCRDGGGRRFSRIAVLSLGRRARARLRVADLAGFVVSHRGSGGQRGSQAPRRHPRAALDGRVRGRLRRAQS